MQALRVELIIVSLQAWKRIAGLVTLLLLAVLAAYTWWVFTKAPSEVWSWGHQLVATFFSVAFTAAAAIWLYMWQSERTAAARKIELRNAQYIGIFNVWDQLKDAHLQDANLPDGSVERVLLTYLQPTIFEESIRSGLFGARDTALLSRLVSAIQTYNNSVVSFLPLAKTFTPEDEEQVDRKQVEQLRNTIYAIQGNRETVVEVSRGLLSLWSIEELRAAGAAASAAQEPDPGIAQFIADIQEEALKTSPGDTRPRKQDD